MFYVSSTGFMLDFPNGWTASVQFGPHNYGSNRDLFGDNQFLNGPFTGGIYGDGVEANTAEIAAWRTVETPSRVWYQFEDGQDVKGWQDITHVMEFLNMVSKLGTKQSVKAQTYFDWEIDY